MSATVKKTLVSLFLGPLFPGNKIRVTRGTTKECVSLTPPPSSLPMASPYIPTEELIPGKCLLHALNTMLLALWQDDLPPHCRVCLSFPVQMWMLPKQLPVPSVMLAMGIAGSAVFSGGWERSFLTLNATTLDFDSCSVYFCPRVHGAGAQRLSVPQNFYCNQNAPSFPNSHRMWVLFLLTNFRK